MRLIHRRRGLVSFAAVAALALAACGSDSDSTTSAASEPTTTVADLQSSGHSTAPATDRIDLVVFHQEMRKLWEDHITWTRLYIVSAVAGLPDLEPTAVRLLQNQADIGAAFATFYGDDVGTTLTELLNEHILIAADIVAAAKAGDQATVTKQSDLWYVNVDQISQFLADANPAWPFDVVSPMMRTHLDQTLAEATARLTGDWDADIAAYDEIHLHILAMADALADGISTQFPDRFST
jgi:hypothetical protein